jgi:hypothetical protein
MKCESQQEQLTRSTLVLGRPVSITLEHEDVRSCFSLLRCPVLVNPCDRQIPRSEYSVKCEKYS